MASLSPGTQLSIPEALRLGAKDVPTFGQLWFPKTVRQASPRFHYDMSAQLETPGNRYVGFKVFRDGAKTTLSRIYIAKRISYCISRTIMLVCINQPKAIQSARWLRRQLAFNKAWTQAFQLKPGTKNTDEWFSIINAKGEEVHVVSYGVTAGLRGVNIDDWRPDFIFCDDISDRENTATKEQRAKQNEVFFAQLMRSLSPESESPMAQMALAQTPINSFDLISQAEKDPSFKVFRHSCFGPDGQSAWPARRSTESLLREKEGYIRRNQLSAWLAEMECELVSAETQALKKSWLKYWEVYPEEGRTVIVCDPASSEKMAADFFAIAVLKFYREKVYLLEYRLARGLMPDQALAQVFDFAATYGSRDVVVETTAYQRILAWYFENQMQERRIWLNVHRVEDRRKKEDRIVQAMTSVAPYGNLLIREGMAEFEEVFELFGPGYGGKVDLLDAVATGITWHISGHSFNGADVEAEFRRLREEEDSLEMPVFQGAP